MALEPNDYLVTHQSFIFLTKIDDDTNKTKVDNKLISESRLKYLLIN